jgi:hypothetical protein
MITLHQDLEAATSAAAETADPLLDLELQIARRADELAKERASGLNLHCWLLAEREICGQMIDSATGPGN